MSIKKSIFTKILIFFLSIIFFVIFSIVSFSKTSLKKNNEIIIDKNVVETTKSINLYLEQYFKQRNLEFNEMSFPVEAGNISKELGYRLDNIIYIYNNRGKIVYPRTNDIPKLKKTSDLEKALNNKISYTIEHEKSETNAYVSHPVITDGDLVGIIRYVNNYTELYKQSQIILNNILIFSIVIFAVSIAIAFFLARRITRPIITLANNTKEISKGNFDVNIEVLSEDELGKLSSDFKYMVEKIKEQINVIEKDRDSLRELSEKQKLFFDNVTHELKTPMTTIIGYSEIIKDNQFSDIEFFNKGISRIICESSRLNRMIVQLIEISRNSAKDFDYELKKINLTEIIKHMCEDMTYKAKKYNITIRYKLDENLKIIANEDKIKEVIINIIDNSIKYSDVNTTIYVEAHKNGNYINISIKDQGKGIEKKELENILNPFYRVSKSDSRELGSTGLGLAIVKSIVESYNGTIDINSSIGIGTEVLIKIPTVD